VTTDEGFREIQLNGKQLVFLFMAAAVVSVVIFLLGVMFGREVRPDRQVAPETASTAVAPDPGASPPAQVAPPSSAQTPSAEPPAPAEELTYYDRLQKNNTPQESLKPSSPVQSVVTAQPVVTEPAAQPAAAPAAKPAQTLSAETHPADQTAGEPNGPGFAVQVATYQDRRDADALTKRLIGKGYPAFVTGPVKAGGKMIYRVRVGKYQDRREAETVSSRLEKEEQFKPWIAR
jgi:cell division septation protein DedD